MCKVVGPARLPHTLAAPSSCRFASVPMHARALQGAPVLREGSEVSGGCVVREEERGVTQQQWITRWRQSHTPCSIHHQREQPNTKLRGKRPHNVAVGSATPAWTVHVSHVYVVYDTAWN